MRLEPCERSRQGTTVKIRIQDGAIYIASEDDEERQVTEIEIDAALRYLNNNALIRQDITHTTVKYALADMCREMRYALTKRTTN